MGKKTKNIDMPEKSWCKCSYASKKTKNKKPKTKRKIHSLVILLEEVIEVVPAKKTLLPV